MKAFVDGESETLLPPIIDHHRRRAKRAFALLTLSFQLPFEKALKRCLAHYGRRDPDVYLEILRKFCGHYAYSGYGGLGKDIRPLLCEAALLIVTLDAALDSKNASGAVSGRLADIQRQIDYYAIHLYRDNSLQNVTRVIANINVTQIPTSKLPNCSKSDIAKALSQRNKNKDYLVPPYYLPLPRPGAKIMSSAAHDWLGLHIARIPGFFYCVWGQSVYDVVMEEYETKGEGLSDLKKAVVLEDMFVW
jgi:hypothetical protein